MDIYIKYTGYLFVIVFFSLGYDLNHIVIHTPRLLLLFTGKHLVQFSLKSSGCNRSRESLLRAGADAIL